MRSIGNIRLSILFLILANIIWGVAFPLYKWTLADVPPFTFVFLRFYLGALILLPFVKNDLKVERQDWKDLILLSLTGVTLGITFLIFGLKYSSSLNAPIIQSAGPIIIIIGAFFYLHEKLKKKVVAGTLVSLTGVLLIFFLPLLLKGLDGSLLGNFYLILASVFGVAHALLLKKILPRYKALTIAFWSFLIGSIPLLPFYFIEVNQTHWVTHLNMQGIVGIAFGAIVATAIAHSIYAYGIKYISASEVGMFTYVDPLATALVAIPLLHESITFPYLIGSALVFLGIFIAEGRLHYHPFQKLRGNS